MKHTKKKSNGFSLIEVLVFTVILSIFFVTSLSVAINSLRSMKVSEHKIIASKYSEEMLEWLRGEKETDWNNFLTKANAAGCTQFDQEVISWTDITNKPCSTMDTNSGLGRINGAAGIYRREVKFTVNTSIPQVDVSIKVIWKESGKSYIAPLQSTFTPWQ